MKVKDILKHRVVGIVADENEGKTNTLFYFIEECKKHKRQICAYFYHSDYRKNVKGVRFVNNLDELERVRDSFIFIDEFAELFQLSNRKFINQVERVFNMVMHNNNVLVLAGVPSYFKKFIAGRVRCWVLKSLTFKNCINGSALKNYVLSLTGDYVGATRINVPIEKMLIEGVFYDVPLLKEYDKKAHNVDIFKGWDKC